MPRRKKIVSETVDKPRTRRKAITSEGRENQLINMAINLAAKQLEEGTASSQVITHFLQLGTEKEKLKLEQMRLENELAKARTEAIRSEKRSEELFEKAIIAMKKYRGDSVNEDSDI